MTEQELREKWQLEKPLFETWGRFIAAEISKSIVQQGRDLTNFLKIPYSVRLKDDESLVDKAFNRGKSYSSPYDDIEDKVGVRFVVLLLEDLELIQRIITTSSKWSFDECKNFEKDKANSPLLFAYQSIHYILRPERPLDLGSKVIPINTPCEVQIRTLLQHAHSELTHDAIYKAKRAVRPQIQRTVAKSMALIETADEFFVAVTRQLNRGPLDDFAILPKLDALYEGRIGRKPYTQKSSIAIWDEFEEFITDDLVEQIGQVMDSTPAIQAAIEAKYNLNSFYHQSVVLFIFWLLKRKRSRLITKWPLSLSILQSLASDLGISLHE